MLVVLAVIMFTACSGIKVVQADDQSPPVEKGCTASYTIFCAK